ncbi:MAG: fimbria/pilus periplasmic chaperone [Pseudomonadota bacterium]|nr:MAG: fimbria/pilus periplasmic chaperone [Pseudomonadota bacterium]
MNLRYITATCALVLLACPAVAVAGILLDKSVVDFKPDEPPRQDVFVINDSATDKAYVKVEVLEVVNPGTEQEERRPVSDPDKAQFVASPAKLILPAKGRKQVRLVNLAAPGSERVFRVNFTPVLPPLQDEGTRIRVVVGYQVLVLIHPDKPAEKLNVRRDGRTLYFENQGNSYVFVGNGKQCDAKGENCVDLPGKRLYAGNTWELTLSHDTPVTFTLTNFKGARTETY